MRYDLRRTIYIGLILLLSRIFVEAGFFKTLGFDIIDGDGNKIILKGYGLGGWLVPEGYMLNTPGYGSPSHIRNQIIDVIGVEETSKFFEEYRKNYVAEKDIELIADWGFNHIRLPFHYELFSPSDTPGVFIEDGFTIIDTLLKWCKSNDLYLILDMHCAPGGQNSGNISDSDGEARLWTEPSNQDRTIDIWKIIAERYAEEEWIIGYDLLNEPVLPTGYSNKVLRDFYVRLRNAIREVDTNHILFIEGNWYGTDFSQLAPRFDPNMVWAFHKYWSETDLGSIQQYRNLRTQTVTPLWLGETGENSNPWFYETVQLMDQQNVGWNWWAHKKFETITSPLSATINSGYQRIIDYWKGQESKPSEEFARTALMEMAENLKLEKCKLNSGVIASLTDPEFGKVSKPFDLHVIPGTIYAVDYDLGTNGVAYSDNEYKKVRWDENQPWNLGYSYRNDGIDIELGENSEPHIVWIEDGEWVNYTIEVVYSGKYNIAFTVSSPEATGSVRVLLDGEVLIESLRVPNTGGWQNWYNILVENLKLPQGRHQIKLVFVKGDFNLKKMIFLPVDNSLIEEITESLYLGKNYPNPFNEETSIPVILKSPHKILVSIYDINGKLVRELFSGEMNPGVYLLNWNGTNSRNQKMASGVYFYQLSAGNIKGTVKSMLFLK